MITKRELIELERDKEAMKYILDNPGKKYDWALLQRVFPPAGKMVMDNFGISCDRVAKLADDLPSLAESA